MTLEYSCCYQTQDSLWAIDFETAEGLRWPPSANCGKPKYLLISNSTHSHFLSSSTRAAGSRHTESQVEWLLASQLLHPLVLLLAAFHGTPEVSLFPQKTSLTTSAMRDAYTRFFTSRRSKCKVHKFDHILIRLIVTEKIFFNNATKIWLGRYS